MACLSLNDKAKNCLRFSRKTAPPSLIKIPRKEQKFITIKILFPYFSHVYILLYYSHKISPNRISPTPRHPPFNRYPKYPQILPTIPKPPNIAMTSNKNQDALSQRAGSPLFSKLEQNRNEEDEVILGSLCRE